MKIIFTEQAKRDWQKLGRSAQSQLRKKLSFYLNTGKPLKFTEKLRNYAWGEYRFRIGDYRIIFDYSNDIIFVLRVGHRKDIYK
jgi:mRNA interferase RelE/StbE